MTVTEVAVTPPNPVQRILTFTCHQAYDDVVTKTITTDRPRMAPFPWRESRLRVQDTQLTGWSLTTGSYLIPALG
jgi:hypothetical protein